MAFFDPFKSAKNLIKGSGGEASPGDSATGNNVVFMQDARKARRFFEHAEIASQSRNYDFAMDHYISGLRFDPDNLKRHQELRETALKRKATGGKPAGMMGIPKIGDSPVDKMLTAEKEWAMDPSSPKLLLAAINAGLAAQAKIDETPAADEATSGITVDRLTLLDVVYWMAKQCLDVIYASPKPDYRHYMALVDIFRHFFDHNDEACDKAVEANKRAVKLNPDNGDLLMSLKNLEAEIYTRRNTSTKKGGFRDNLLDAKAQADIQADIGTSGVGLDNLIDRRRKEYREEPENLDMLLKLVDALVKKEDIECEKEAIQLLIKAHEASKEYRHRMRAAEIQMQQFNRVGAELRKRADESQKTEDREVYNKLRSKQLKFELEHFTERAAQYPTDMKVRFELGKRQWKAQMFDDAIASFQGAKNDPKSRSDANYHLGLCYGKKEWLDESVEAFEAAMDGHQFEDDRLGKEIRYELMLALARAAKAENSIEKAEKAQKIASNLLQIDINYRDIREKLDVVRALAKKLKGQG